MTAPSERYGMSEAPTACFGGWYSWDLSLGRAYMPERKKVIVALYCSASLRKRGNWPSSVPPAPSQENTTNCGGRSPGLSFSGLGWFGCGPVSAVEPSPIGVPLGTTAWVGSVVPVCPAFGLVPEEECEVESCPEPDPLLEQAATAPRAAVAAVALSTVLREMLVMVSPGCRSPVVGAAPGRTGQIGQLMNIPPLACHVAAAATKVAGLRRQSTRRGHRTGLRGSVVCCGPVTLHTARRQGSTVPPPCPARSEFVSARCGPSLVRENCAPDSIPRPKGASRGGAGHSVASRRLRRTIRAIAVLTAVAAAQETARLSQAVLNQWLFSQPSVTM